jgi:menaquinol-cytochrome c reductase iron-sulfur subunit
MNTEPTTQNSSAETGPSVGESLADAGAPLHSRRQFFARLSLGLAGIGAALTGVPIVGFLFAPLFGKPPQQWQSVGSLRDFQIGETRLVTFEDPSPLPWAGVTARAAAWVRREGENEIIAFAINCTHLGCPVRWLSDANIFMCPCHGGVFYQDGRVAAGPPPRPLFRYESRVRNGQIELLTGELPITG